MLKQQDTAVKDCDCKENDLESSAKTCSVWTGPNSCRSVPFYRPNNLCVIHPEPDFPSLMDCFWEWRVSCGRMQSQPPCLKTEPRLVNLLLCVPASAQSASLPDRSRSRFCLLCRVESKAERVGGADRCFWPQAVCVYVWRKLWCTSSLYLAFLTNSN